MRHGASSSRRVSHKPGAHAAVTDGGGPGHGAVPTGEAAFRCRPRVRGRARGRRDRRARPGRVRGARRFVCARRAARAAGAGGSLCGGAGRGGPRSLPPSAPGPRCRPRAQRGARRLPWRGAVTCGCGGGGGGADARRGGAGGRRSRGCRHLPHTSSSSSGSSAGLCGAAGAPMPGPTQALSPNGENNNDIIQDNGTIIPFRKHTVRGERSYRYCGGAAAARGRLHKAGGLQPPPLPRPRIVRLRSARGTGGMRAGARRARAKEWRLKIKRKKERGWG